MNKRSILQFALFAIVTIGLTISPIGLEVVYAQAGGGSLLDGLGILTNITFGNIIEALSVALINLAALFEGTAGVVFDTALNTLVLDMSNMLANIAIIEDAWAILRDIANIAFIFVILYVAVSYILNIGRFNMSRVLVRIVVVALLLNFSLFFTNVVVDASNVLALQFDQAAEITSAETGKEIGFSAMIKNQLGTFEFVYDSWNDTMGALTNGVFGSIFLAITGMVFLIGAGLLVTRFVVLVLVMIFAPLAFVALIGAGTNLRKYWSMWLNKLLSWSFLAPALTGMLYISTLIITSEAFQNTTSVEAALDGETALTSAAGQAVLNYALVTGFVVASVVVAKQMSDGMASSTVRFVSNKVAGTGAYAGRKIGGWAGNKLRQSDTMKQWAQSDNDVAQIAGRLGLKAGDKAAKGNWDVRNTSAGGSYLGNQLGMNSRGSRQSYEDDIEDQKKKDDRMKELLSDEEYSDTEKQKIQMANQLEQAQREFEQALEEGDEDAIQAAQQQLREQRQSINDVLEGEFEDIQDELLAAQENLEDMREADGVDDEALQAAQNRLQQAEEDYTQSIADRYNNIQQAIADAEERNDTQALQQYRQRLEDIEAAGAEWALQQDIDNPEEYFTEQGRNVDEIRKAAENQAQDRADIRQLKWADDLDNSIWESRILSNSAGDRKAAESIRNQVRSGSSSSSSGGGDDRPTREDVAETLRYSTDRSEDEIQEILDAMEREGRIQNS